MHRHYPRQQGFSLAELMIAMALGLMIVAGMTALFVSNNGAQAEIERAGRQVENGRYAMQLLSADLNHAGFYSEFNPTVLPLPAALPDPCDITDMAAFKAAIKLPVQGYDNAGATTVSCLEDVLDGRDVLVVRHAETCVIGAADCDPASAGGPFLQVSLCNNSDELGLLDVNQHYEVSTSAAMGLHERDCSTLSKVRRQLTHIYFVAANNEGTDGVPTLKRAEIVSPGGVMQVRIVPLVEGIEHMQLEYGMDTGTDGVPDAFAADPSVFNACAAAACATQNWSNVVAVRVHLLARSTSASPLHLDKKQYKLGSHTVAAANDGYRRHVFQALVTLPNPTGRKAL